MYRNRYKSVLNIRFLFVLFSAFTVWMPGPSFADSPQANALLPDFYKIDHASVAGELGSIIKVEEIPAPDGANAWRIVYRSQTAAGIPAAVSGIVIAPETAQPGEDRPIVSWAHGTVGVARYCAPSNVPNPATNFVGYQSFESDVPNDYGVPGLSGFLRAGYIVVATDYQGLGAGERHEYIVGLTQARNAMDIIRSARFMLPSAGSKAVVIGWSQGGLTALFAGENADYILEIELVGVAAMAPANPASFLIPEISKLSTGGPVTGRTVLLARGYSWAYDDLELADMLTDLGVRAAEASGRQCIQQLSTTADAAGGPPALIEATNDNLEAWVKRFIENAPGQRASLSPVLVMQGTDDATIPPASTDMFISKACQFSTPILRIDYEGTDHRPLIHAAEIDIASWVKSRLSGAPPETSCSN